MSNLLISEPPLQVLPSLAVKVGLNEAIVLQQFHYWLERSNNIRDSHRWIYNSYQNWCKQFPFWSSATLRRTINNLEKQGLLISGNYNKAGFDKTKWYRIDYKRISKASAQNEQTKCSKRADGSARNEQTNTNRLSETTTETTTETTKEYSASKTNGPSLTQLKSDFEEIWADYPNKQGKGNAFNHYKAWRKKSKEHTNSYLIEKLKNYKIYCQQNRWYRPMNGSTWFNGRFDDELEIHGMDQEQKPTTKEDLFRQ